MSHPYPPHRPDLPYTGKHHHFLTFCTDQRKPVFVEEPDVTLVRTQILRAAGDERFEITAYCFMPDHAHVLAAGRDESSDARKFIKLAKQYSGYYFKQRNGIQLWQRYGFERVIRDDAELALTLGYMVTNPVRAGLVDHPAKYPYIGSQRYTVAELLLICEYERIFRLKAEAT
jgi:putative transposase